MKGEGKAYTFINIIKYAFMHRLAKTGATQIGTSTRLKSTAFFLIRLLVGDLQLDALQDRNGGDLL